MLEHCLHDSLAEGIVEKVMEQKHLEMIVWKHSKLISLISGTDLSISCGFSSIVNNNHTMLCKYSNHVLLASR